MPGKRKRGFTTSTKTITYRGQPKGDGETQLERFDGSQRPTNTSIPPDAKSQVAKISTYRKKLEDKEYVSTEINLDDGDHYSGEHWEFTLPTPCGKQCQPLNWDEKVSTHRIYDLDLNVLPQPPTFLYPATDAGQSLGDLSGVVTKGEAAYKVMQSNMDIGAYNTMFVMTKVDPKSKFDKSVNPYSEILAIHAWALTTNNNAINNSTQALQRYGWTKTEFNRMCFLFHPLYAALLEFVPHNSSYIAKGAGATLETQSFQLEGHFRLHEYRRNDDMPGEYAIDRLCDRYLLSMMTGTGLSANATDNHGSYMHPARRMDLTMQLWYQDVDVKASNIYLQGIDMFQIKDLDDEYTSKAGEKVATDCWVNTGSFDVAVGVNLINDTADNILGYQKGKGIKYSTTSAASNGIILSSDHRKW